MEIKKAPYPVTYWENIAEKLVVVRVNDTTLQGWQVKGRDIEGEFEHRHFQTVYPSKERLEEYLRGFSQTTRDVYLAYQFEHHQLDDFWRERANAIRDHQWRQGQVPINRNPPPVPPRS